MTKLIGRTKANYYMMTGERILAEKALSLNIVSHVFEESQFDSEVIKLAEKIATKS